MASSLPGSDLTKGILNKGRVSREIFVFWAPWVDVLGPRHGPLSI